MRGTEKETVGEKDEREKVRERWEWEGEREREMREVGREGKMR